MSFIKLQVELFAKNFIQIKFVFLQEEEKEIAELNGTENGNENDSIDGNTPDQRSNLPIYPNGK